MASQKKCFGLGANDSNAQNLSWGCLTNSRKINMQTDRVTALV